MPRTLQGTSPRAIILVLFVGAIACENSDLQS